MSDVKKHEQIVISEINDRTHIIFKKAALKGKATNADVHNAVLIAARMQAEKYIEKLSRGAPLDTQEIRALKDLADICKIEAPQIQINQQNLGTNAENMNSIKQSLYQALTDRISKQT